ILDFLLNNYFSENKKNDNGIAIAIANFNMRGIKSKNGLEIKVLEKEFVNPQLSSKRRGDALFAFARLGSDRNAESELIKILSEKDNKNNFYLKQNALAAFRRLKYFPQNLTILKELFNSSDWRIRTEAVKSACYYKFSKQEELRIFFSMLNDKNPNVGRQAAISMREIKFDSIQTFYLKDELKKRIADYSYRSNIAGEAFITYSKFFPKEIFDLAGKWEGKINSKFIFRAMTEDLYFPSKNFAYLSKNLNTKNKAEKLEILTAMLALQKQMSGNQLLANALISNLSSGYAAGVALVADGLDSVFITLHREELQKIVGRQIRMFLNNAMFGETIISLLNLSRKTGEDLWSELIKEARQSTIPAVREYAAIESSTKNKISGDLTNFYKIWSFVFKYKTAKIVTDKGEFKMRLDPEFAPISVGNFCYLASTDFFNNNIFHRVVPDFVIQGGDPDATGWGGPGYNIKSEFSPLSFDESAVGMASSGRDTEGSQWFVMHSSYPHLNGRYTNFGHVIEGKDVVDNIDEGDRIIKVILE
ncbi:MAG: peptidylprolyl isomerase, partial [Methanococcaceae archaeon]